MSAWSLTHLTLTTSRPPLCSLYLLGTTNDISPLLYFTFYQLVYYHMDDTPFCSDSHEHCGCWVGVSETIHNLMTFKILTDDTKKIIHHSNIHSACDPSSQNLWMDTTNDEAPQVIKSFHSPSTSPSHEEDSMTVMGDDASDLIDNDSHCMSVICANDLVGCMFLMDPREDGQCHCAISWSLFKIMSMI